MSIEFTVSDLARRLGVSPGTIRNYTRVFAEYLSPVATPPRGRTRLFTTEDARKLTCARQLLSEGATYAAVKAQLRIGIPSTVSIEVPPLPEPEEPKPKLVPLDGIELIIQPYIGEANRLRRERDEALARIAELERELGRLEARLEWLEHKEG